MKVKKEITKLNARDCEVRSISQDDYKAFVKENHKQQYAAASKIYGLYKDNELVMLMSFGKPRFNKLYQFEIIRECTKKDYQVRGGTSKLWSYFINNNSVHSCICYSYPHDGKFTDHYIKHCGFKNLKNSKPEKKVYFEGKWKGKVKRIDKSILERHGVDRLLRTKQGQDRTNEQILLDLGFEKKYEDSYSPQVDTYYPFSVLYRVDDVTDNSFYIGMCEVKEQWEERNYLGSGTRWNNHRAAHPEHEYKRTILEQDFKTPKDLREAEYIEIKKYVLEHSKQLITKTKGKLLNIYLRKQEIDPHHDKICSECGGKGGLHKKTCSKYTTPKPCPECGGVMKHYKTCSKYKTTPCPECGGKMGNHKSTCSKYKICKECGGINNRHYKTCSKYKAPKPCPECGALKGHKKNCSKYKKPAPCSECGKIKGHKKGCSKYTTFFCEECGGERGAHKKGCSKYKGNPVCPECGHKTHLKTCSRYKQSKACPECGAIKGHHTNCSKYKKPKPRKPCPECGTLGRHKKGCSKHVEGKVYSECGGKNNQHKKGCSKYVYTPNTKSCPECGGKMGKHKLNCSKYKK